MIQTTDKKQVLRLLKELANKDIKYFKYSEWKDGEIQITAKVEVEAFADNKLIGGKK